MLRQQIPDAMRLATRLTGNLHDAEDIVQEAFLRAARAKDAFRGESSLRTWISRIVVNVFRTSVSRHKPTESLSEDPSRDARRTGIDISLYSSEQCDRARLVASQVSNLPERQREVLVMCVYENMSAAEVAEALNLTVQNVYANLSAARKQLRESLALLLKRDS